uniref:Uncharacterized protein n=1 Tax=Leptobrachium leishanense TaxID=445787 RepID=A0A8C5LYK8_9ANUR
MAAAKPNPIRDLQDELTCSICLDNFRDPVSIECGHSFCRDCISRSWRGIHSQFSCPQCRKVSKWKFLRPNRLVENVVEITKRMLDTKPSPGKKCETHQEPFNLYCVDDGVEICLVCRESIFHKSHNVIPVEESTREFEGDVNLKRRILSAEFENLRQLIEYSERAFKDRLDNIEKTIAQKRNENISKLDAKLSELQKRIDQIEKRTSTPASKKSQDVKSTASRYCDGEQFLEPGLSNPYGTAIKDYLKMFTVPVMFDHKTANYNLLVAGNRKFVTYEEYPNNFPPHPGRFDTKPCVLGLTGYKFGKRYWEVEVGDGIYWSVGVARQSACRNGAFKIQPAGGIWAIGLLGMYMDRYYAFTNPDILLYPKNHPNRVGVFLDCEDQNVVFYNAITMEHLHTFTFVHPTEKLYPFFCVGAMGTELRLD